MLREGFRRAFRSVRLPIAGGPNEGLLWSLATRGRGYGTGRFEAQRVRAIAGLIRPGECVWDIGAHKGYVSLVASRCVGPAGRVVAFEPAEANLWFLRNHVRWNHVDNVEIVPVAVADYDGEANFGGRSSLAMKLGQGEQRVAVRSLRSLIESGAHGRPTFLKIDVEGAEADVLRGVDPDLLGPDCLLMIATHTPALYAACRDRLASFGFRVVESRELAAANAQGWEGRGDPDLLAFGPRRAADRAALELYACA